MLEQHRNIATIEQRHASVGDMQISYQVAGAGFPLVLVHGLSASSRWWRWNVPELARRFQVYVVDLIGFGQNARRHPFVLEEAASYLARWIEQLGIERVHLIGHSMGGFICADLAADHPELVDRLVLVDAVALPLTRSTLQHGWGLIRALRYMPFNFLPVLAGDAYHAGPSAVVKAARELLRADIRAKLARIDRPVLVIWGEHDTLVPLEIGRRLEQELAQAELVVIPGAGHNPMWDRPTDFNRAVVAFLDRAPVAESASPATSS
jgi:pimeloyl-ACP methyl ester carboxylesterase